jgi:S-adenosylmethionine:tRNA ribosyltransferase-isomerase
MRTDEFDYALPRELIAQHPTGDRTSSRLLVLSKADKRIQHVYFRDIPRYLTAGDVMVLNDTRVLPSRLRLKKATGGIVDVLLVDRTDDRKRWTCLVNGIKRSVHEMPVYAGETRVTLKPSEPFWFADFDREGDDEAIMSAFGRMPLPHYIKRAGAEDPEDDERYQTVYAQSSGSIAAPTAGLHFDEDLLDRIRRMGVEVVKITLHIGVGTFFLIKTKDVEEHEMHREYYSLRPETLAAVAKAKAEGRRVIAVGTSAARTLETACARENKAPCLSGYTGLFIYPGYRFRVADGLITNFHLPRSTPLMLVSAFAGKSAIDSAYREAIEQGYRFYSYGDSMFVS